MPERARGAAYEDRAVAIGEGQTISQPYMVALMTELLELRPADRVLEIGTGSGYQTAILAEIAGHVDTIERHRPLAERAQAVLETLAYRNIRMLVGDGTQGYEEGGPYDAILVAAGGPYIPASLEEQMAIGARMVCPVGRRDVQELIRVERTPSGLEKERTIRCSFVPLIGEEGWAEGTR
jgi:protein-L-isoaspartate(D-aspartate) O-methyltransferase